MKISITDKRIKSFDGSELRVKIHQNCSNIAIEKKLVFVHGVANNAEVWEALVDELLMHNANLQCICYDLRSHGFSSKKFSELADLPLEVIHALDLREVLEKVAIPWWSMKQNMSLIGHSLGGIIIQEYLNLGIKQKVGFQKINQLEEGLQHKKLSKKDAQLIKELVLIDNIKKFSGRRSVFKKINDGRLKPQKMIICASNIMTRKVPAVNRWDLMKKFELLAINEHNDAVPLDIDDYFEKEKLADFSLKNILSTAGNLSLNNSVLHWLGLANWVNPHPELINNDRVTFVWGKNDKIFPAKDIKQTFKRFPLINSIEIDSEHGMTTSNYGQLANIIERIVLN